MRLAITTRNVGVTTDVLFPDNPKLIKKVFWLLHDSGKNSSDWVSFTRAELYAREYNVAFICLSAFSAKYTNWVRGDYWETYLAERLPDFIREMFPMLSHSPEDNILFGFGSGGFGAIKLALSYPERYGSAYAIEYDDSFVRDYIFGKNVEFGDLIYGSPEKAAGSGNNVLQLAKTVSGAINPQIRFITRKNTPGAEHAEDISQELFAYGYDAALDIRGVYIGGECELWRFTDSCLETVTREICK